MHATCVEDLQVFQRAKTFVAAVFALTRGFRSDFWLGDQLNESAESMMSNISEGFRQTTDRAFARYLAIAAGSAEEARTHLLAAELKGLAVRPRSSELRAEASEIANMLGGLIRYLRRSDRKDRFVQPPYRADSD
jgi:four helix bundle protein